MLRSYLKRLQTINIPFLSTKKFQGYDLTGNMYFETNIKGGKAKRTVTYKDAKLNHHTSYNTESIPIQWQSWMRHTRPDAPTLEELQLDEKRIQDLQTVLELKQTEEQKLIPENDQIESWKPKSNR